MHRDTGYLTIASSDDGKYKVAKKIETSKVKIHV